MQLIAHDFKLREFKAFIRNDTYNTFKVGVKKFYYVISRIFRIFSS